MGRLLYKLIQITKTSQNLIGECISLVNGHYGDIHSLSLIKLPWDNP